MTDLLPCPFCGSAPESEPTPWLWTISCPNINGCSTYLLVYGTDEANAVEKWNRRPSRSGPPVDAETHND